MQESVEDNKRRKWARAFAGVCALTALVLIALFYYSMGKATGEFPVSRAQTEGGLGLHFPKEVEVRCLFELAPPGQYQAVARMSAAQFGEFARVNGLRWKRVEAEDAKVREYVKWARQLPRLGMWDPVPAQTLLMDDGREKVAKPLNPDKV